MLSGRAAATACLLIAACGARTDIGGEAGDAAAPMDARTDDARADAADAADTSTPPPPDTGPRCDDRRPAPRTVRPGPCEARGLECGPGCGDCTDDEICASGRCYLRVGPGPVNARATDGSRILRRLAGNPQGERHALRLGGILEAVEVSLWASSESGGARLDVYRRCGGEESTLLRTARLDVGELGAYDGIRSPLEPVILELESPLRVAADDVLEVLVGPEGGATLVIGVHRGDPYPDGRAIEQFVPGVFGEFGEREDNAVTLLLHEG